MALIPEVHFQEYLKERRRGGGKPATVTDIIETVFIERQVAELDDRDLDPQTEESRIEHEAIRRSVRGVRRRLHSVFNLMKRFGREGGDRDELLFELCLVAASELTYGKYRVLLGRLISDNHLHQVVGKLRSNPEGRSALRGTYFSRISRRGKPALSRAL